MPYHLAGWPSGCCGQSGRRCGVFGQYKWTFDRFLCIWHCLIKPTHRMQPSSRIQYMTDLERSHLTWLLDISLRTNHQNKHLLHMCKNARLRCLFVRSYLTGFNTRLQPSMETTADTRDRQSDSELLFTSWEIVIYRLDSFVRVRLSTYSMLAERQAQRP